MNILILGAGRMGFGASWDLIHNSPVDHVTVADVDPARLAELEAKVGSSKLTIQRADVEDRETTLALMKGHDAIISCVVYRHNVELARLAIAAGANFCDLGGNNDVVAAELALDSDAKRAGVNVIPDCGLAPGMVSILVMHALARLDSVEGVHIRVGGLPQKPRPPLDYQLVFSVEGLINEYIEPAQVIRDGRILTIPSMTEVESLSFPSFPTLEAFQTSGGTSTLPDTLLGRVRELDYKTIRYAGHCEKFKTMIDLGLCSSEGIQVHGADVTPRRLFGELLMKNLPADEPDFVLIRVEAVGIKGATRQRIRYDIVDRYDEKTGLSAMMRTTAFPASIVAQMMASGVTTAKGALPQERCIPIQPFIDELARRDIRIVEQTEFLP
ncbi:MAG TPA: saccharopine dehydrogenase C-terminal domain-containing protein [Thermoanaerobaculia bacterium]|nr:saccharopine dehydrogenase C-terminal domain-containing protein [Thermoanaerobaculia bacterium]